MNRLGLSPFGIIDLVNGMHSSEAWSSLASSRLVSVDKVSSSSDPQSISHARKVLEHEISDALGVITSVKTLRNSLLPIHRLPPDILFKIFHVIATQDSTYREVKTASGKKESRYCAPLDVYKLTHVCRHWKDVALQFPLLWTNIPLHKAKWASEFLRRSQGAPLSLSLETSSTDLSPAVLATLSETQRLQHLSLKGPVNVALQRLSTPAPVLESFTVHFTPIYHYGYDNTEPIIEPDIFAQDAPKLRRIVARGVGFPWNSPILNNLTHLEVHNDSAKSSSPSDRRKPRQRPSVVGFFDALRRMPNLTTLILHNSIPTFPAGTAVLPGAEATVRLPSVTYLSLGGPLLDCALIAQQLSVHADASLAYECYMDNRAWSTYDLAVKDIAKWSSRPYLSLSWEHARSDRSYSETESVISSEIETLFRVIPIDTVRVLAGSLDSHLLSPDSWHETWGRATAVEKVHVSGTEELESFLEAWTKPISDDTPDQYLFPRLKKLAIDTANFRDEDSEIDHKDLMMGIKDRKHLGLPLDEVSIRYCRIDKNQVQALSKKKVAKVVWDGDIYGLWEPEPSDHSSY
ncbi:hypothetical protein EVG20_g5253 [Dentipellis fragilis]|uniref:F-box domain-containing protein n=1 Tax=Dentipellis fragilis TaxID=205917 RepID=A0A4Y9YXI2_9AGAM|nr:hypothetical protein EVG20_g5253 [Dentipellis fragilis]